MLSTRPLRLGAIVALITASIALAACGSSNDSSSSSSSSASTSSSGGSGGDAAAKKQAADAIAPYTGKPSAFPVTEPLKKKLPAGSKIAFMDCGTPICALFRDLAKPAAKAMGVDLVVVKTGANADSINSAFASVVQSKPSAVIVTALDPIIWQSSLEKLKAAKIPIVATGIVDGDKYGLQTFPNSVMFGKDASAAGRQAAGRLGLQPPGQQGERRSSTACPS